MSDQRITLSYIVALDEVSLLDVALAEIMSIAATARDHLELIVVDALVNDKSKKALARFSHQTYLSTLELPGGSVAEAFNVALDTAQGQYVHFARISSYLDCRCLEAVVESLGSNESESQGVPDTVCFQPTSRGYDRASQARIFERENLDLTSFDMRVSERLELQFLTRDDSLRFNDKLHTENALTDYLVRASASFKKGLLLVGSAEFIEKFPEEDFNTYPPQYEDWWYTATLNEVTLPFLKEVGTPFAQTVAARMIALRYAMNMNARYKGALTGEALSAFEKGVQTVLDALDWDAVLRLGEYDLVPKMLPDILSEMKSAQEVESTKGIEIDREVAFLSTGSREDFLNRNACLKIKIIDQHDGALYFDFAFSRKRFIDAGARIDVSLDDQGIPATITSVYSETLFFDQVRHTDFTGKFSIPLEDLTPGSKISFTFVYGEHTIKLPIIFISMYSKLNANIFRNSWYFSKRRLRCVPKGRALEVNASSPLRTLGYELSFVGSVVKRFAFSSRTLQFLALRGAYWATRPFYRKKNVWITFDKLYKAGDNGNYLFDYVMGLSGADVPAMYYVINKNAKDYARLKAVHGKNVVPFNSFKHKLLSLHATMILATHAGVPGFSGFGKTIGMYFRDLFSATTCCLSHGLTVQQIAVNQNRVKDNTRFYCLASHCEKENLLQPAYDYEEKDLVYTGQARYDGLKGSPKKQILVTPTWRKNLAKVNLKIGTSREYNPHFKDSDFFRLYNEIINDSRLIEAARETGYEIVFLLHPVISSQAKDFSKNPAVKIVRATGDMSYEAMLSESALMVTDYSGVQFDFAYMRRPLVYFHPDELPAHYEESFFKYDTMAFGPICKQREALIDEICDQMRAGCVMSDEYKQRADDFFEFSDYNNSQRIYEAVRAFQAQP